MQWRAWSVHPKSDATFLTVYRLYQAAEQSEVDAVCKVVEDDFETDDGEFGVVKVEEDLVEDDLVENDLVECIKSEAVQRLPCLSPLSNVHVELSPWKL